VGAATPAPSSSVATAPPPDPPVPCAVGAEVGSSSLGQTTAGMTPLYVCSAQSAQVTCDHVVTLMSAGCPALIGGEEWRCNTGTRVRV